MINYDEQISNYRNSINMLKKWIREYEDSEFVPYYRQRMHLFKQELDFLISQKGHV